MKELKEKYLSGDYFCVQDSTYRMNLDFIETYDERNNYKIMELK